MEAGHGYRPYLLSCICVRNGVDDFQPHPGPFLCWYEDRLDFVGDLINAKHWNMYGPYERSVFYYILIQALPIVVIEGGPLLVIVFAVTEYILRREMKGKGR